MMIENSYILVEYVDAGHFGPIQFHAHSMQHPIPLNSSDAIVAFDRLIRSAVS